jgi:hypothetical protein
MSAAILAFPERRKIAPEPVKVEVTEAECRLLDSTKHIVDHVLDVVNTDQKLIKAFLAGDKTIKALFRHRGVEYNVQVSLDEITNFPGVA